jgi:hypothetical protein
MIEIKSKHSKAIFDKTLVNFKTSLLKLGGIWFIMSVDITKLDKDSLDAIAEAALVNFDINKVGTKYKTVQTDAVVYDGGVPTHTRISKVTSYKDPNIFGVDTPKDKIVDYNDWLRSQPDYKDVTYDKLKTSSGTPIYLGDDPRITKHGDHVYYTYFGLGDADDKYKNIQYTLKNRVLNKFCTWTSAMDFYKDLYVYPDDYIDSDKGAIIYTDKTATKHKTRLFDQYDLGVKTSSRDLITYAHDVYTPESGFLSSKAKFVHNYFAFVVDVDSVLAAALYEYLQHDWGVYLYGNKSVKHYPKPTYIVNSGTGLHLYYVLSTPVPNFPFNSDVLSLLNKTMQQVYNTYSDRDDGQWYYISGQLCGKPQRMCSLAQAFRMAGSNSKFDTKVTVYKYGTKYEIDDLLHVFGLDDAVGHVKLRHDDHDKTIYKLFDNDKFNKRVKTIEGLRDQIIKSSTNLYDDLVLYADFCAGTRFYDVDGFTLDKILSDVHSIIDATTIDKTGFDLDGLTNIISTNYYKINKASKIDFSLFSFKNNKTDKTNKTTSYKYATNFYVGVLRQVKNNLVVGHRRNSMYALGLLAFSCGVPEKQYKDDMHDVYNIIQTRVQTLNEKQFTVSDYNSALKSWKYASDNNVRIKQKTLSDLLGPCWPNRPSRDAYQRNYKNTIKKEHYTTYCLLVASEICIYILETAYNKLEISLKNNSDKNIWIDYPTISDLLAYDGYKYPNKQMDIVTKDEFIVNVGASDKPTRYFYSKYYNYVTLALFYKISDNILRDLYDLADKFKIKFYINIFPALDSKNRVAQACRYIYKNLKLDNKDPNKILLKLIAMYTGLSKPTILKYISDPDIDGLYHDLDGLDFIKIIG